jgi:hypothetical protein
MVVYIAGPITGQPNYNTSAFKEAERVLRYAGHTVLNPRNTPLGLTYAAYMDISLAMIRASDQVYALEGWSKSKGAATEVAYATSLNKPITGAKS